MIIWESDNLRYWQYIYKRYSVSKSLSSLCSIEKLNFLCASALKYAHICEKFDLLNNRWFAHDPGNLYKYSDKAYEFGWSNGYPQYFSIQQS